MTGISDTDRLVVVVSGAAGSVGSALVRYFQTHKATVIGIDRTRITEATSGGCVEHLFRVDLAQPTGTADLMKSISEVSPSVDILVNAAGTFFSDAQVSEQPDRWTQLWNDNVTSAVFLSQNLHPLLQRAAQPLVVNVASTDAVVASAGQCCEIGVCHDTLYATTKGALVTLTRALAMAWASDGIRVNAVCPTIIPGQMTKALLATPTKAAELTSFIPLRTLCSPEDVAVAVHTLYHLKMTTGHTLPLDGGYLCV